MPTPITRQDQNGKHERWSIEIGDDLVTLTTPDGRTLLEWAPENVSNSVRFPSFSRNIKYVGFRVAGRGLHEFSLDSATARKLRDFADRAILARGPQAVQSILRSAILTSAAGLTVFCTGAAFLSITIYELATDKSLTDGRPHIVGLVTTLVGVAILCRGIYTFHHYSRLKRLLV
jgi:hypothetical protein